VALAVGRNAVVVATGSELAAYRISDGRSLWKRPLETRPVPWGLAMDRNGRVLVSLEGGKVACFGASGGKLASLR
jgi:outer membrane protein assembly factor BamB